MASILYPTLVLGGLGAVLSVILLVAARKFAVYEDPLIAAVEDALPNANCGACGEAGCHAFAAKLVETRDSSMFCPPGGASTSEHIAELLGIEASSQEVPVAIVMCGGKLGGASFVGRYEGLEDCRAATLIDGGAKLCPYGCVGLGSCVVACAYGAIHIEDGVAVVDEAECVGCGACVKACPKGLIRMGPRSVRVYVACVSNDKGKDVRGYCDVGCIGCKRCVKACDYDAMQFDDFLARVDHDKCTECGACIDACPRNIVFGVHLSTEAMARAYPPKEEKPAPKEKPQAKAAASAPASESTPVAAAAAPAPSESPAEGDANAPATDVPEEKV